MQSHEEFRCREGKMAVQKRKHRSRSRFPGWRRIESRWPCVRSAIMKRRIQAGAWLGRRTLGTARVVTKSGTFELTYYVSPRTRFAKPGRISTNACPRSGSNLSCKILFDFVNQKILRRRIKLKGMEILSKSPIDKIIEESRESIMAYVIEATVRHATLLFTPSKMNVTVAVAREAR